MAKTKPSRFFNLILLAVWLVVLLLGYQVFMAGHGFATWLYQGVLRSVSP